LTIRKDISSSSKGATDPLERRTFFNDDCDDPPNILVSSTPVKCPVPWKHKNPKNQDTKAMNKATNPATSPATTSGVEEFELGGSGVSEVRTGTVSLICQNTSQWLSLFVLSFGGSRRH
jgi:hypothetical protein